MKYRTLGRTGLKVSEIALGCEGFLLKDDGFAREMFQTALAAGVNCMDLYSPNPDLQRRVGEAVRGRREDFILQCHLCSIWDQGQYRATREPGEVKAAFETLLANLDTGYVDIGMIHYVDSPELWEQIEKGPVMAYAQERKARGSSVVRAESGTSASAATTLWPPWPPWRAGWWTCSCSPSTPATTSSPAARTSSSFGPTLPSANTRRSSRVHTTAPFRCVMRCG